MPTNRFVKPAIPILNDKCYIRDIYKNKFRRVREDFPEAMASKLRVKVAVVF